MLIDKKLLNELKQLGLNSYEIRIWTALLAKGSSTAGELAEIADVPRSRSYDVLESLEKKGFVIQQFGKPIRFLPVSPEEALERVKKRIIDETKSKIKYLEEIKNTEIIKELNALFYSGLEKVDPLEMSGAIRGYNNILHHFKFLLNNSKKCIKIATTSYGFKRKINSLFDELKKAKENNINISILVPFDDSIKDEIELAKKIGEIKDAKALKSRFTLFDNEDLLLFITHDKIHPNFQSAIWIKSKVASESLNNLFDSLWNSL